MLMGGEPIPPTDDHQRIIYHEMSGKVIDAVVESVRARCLACGRSSADFLSLSEAFEANGYSKSTCTSCLLTDRPRPKPSDA